VILRKPQGYSAVRKKFKKYGGFFDLEEFPRSSRIVANAFTAVCQVLASTFSRRGVVDRLKTFDEMGPLFTSWLRARRGDGLRPQRRRGRRRSPPSGGVGLVENTITTLRP